MSATLPNLAELARWLDADLYVNKFRPQRVQEYIVNSGRLFKCGDLKLPENMFDLEISETLKANMKFITNENEQLQELVKKEESALVFCYSRN